MSGIVISIILCWMHEVLICVILEEFKSNSNIIEMVFCFILFNYKRLGLYIKYNISILYLEVVCDMIC